MAPGVGFTIPIAATIGYLVITGSFEYFIDIVRNFYPLYGQMTYTLQSSILPSDRPAYVILNMIYMSRNTLWLIPAIVAIGLLRLRRNFNTPQKLQFWLLISLILCYWIMPALAGQFFTYHWIIFLYFILQLGSFCFIDDEPVPQVRRYPNRPFINALLPRVTMIVVILVSPLVPQEFNDQIRGLPLPPPNDGRVDTFSGYLSAHMQPGDRVQALDWTGGALQAMLMTQAVPATRFTEDFWLYAYLYDPYIQGLRSQFIAQFSAAMPRFVLEVFGPDRPWITGPDTSHDFQALQTILAANYQVVLEGDQYRIYQRRPSTTEAF